MRCPSVPDLSATGNALELFGGPQMGYSIPQIVYEIGLHGARNQRCRHVHALQQVRSS
jgi:hypothetical protein